MPGMVTRLSWRLAVESALRYVQPIERSVRDRPERPLAEYVGMRRIDFNGWRRAHSSRPHAISDLELALDLLQALSLGLGQILQDEHEAGTAYSRVQPECRRHAERPLQKRECIDQHEAGEPHCGDGNRNRLPADPVGKDLRDQYPGYGSERERVARHRREHGYDDDDAAQAESITQADQSVEDAYSGATDQHDCPAPKAIHREDRHERKEQEHDAGDADVKEHAAHTVAGRSKYFLGVAQDHIDAAPLLQDRERHPDQQGGSDTGREQVARAQALTTRERQGRLDFRELAVGVLRPAHARQNSSCLPPTADFHQPSGALRNE